MLVLEMDSQTDTDRCSLRSDKRAVRQTSALANMQSYSPPPESQKILDPSKLHRSLKQFSGLPLSKFLNDAFGQGHISSLESSQGTRCSDGR
jgi:hypothetical protein